MIYAKEGQKTELEMLGNTKGNLKKKRKKQKKRPKTNNINSVTCKFLFFLGSAGFNAFLETMGEKIKLFGWKKYAAGLDVKAKSTGTYSVFTEMNDYQIMVK
jgi:hypothetical protein